MSIIPVTGMANALMAVTISLHPSAHHAQASYTVRQGDTLSTIAAHAYHNAADWPAAIMFGLRTWRRLAHHTAGQSAALW